MTALQARFLGSTLQEWLVAVATFATIVAGLRILQRLVGGRVARIPEMIRDIIETRELTRFDRSHFKEYGESALVIETVYYVLSPEYNVYMDFQQAVNLEIGRRFEEAGIEFTYPTRTLYHRGPEPLSVAAAPAAG